MLYSGFIVDQGVRCVWRAHSKDGLDWTQEKTPLVAPIEGENNDLYGPSLFQWEGKNYVVYQDHTGNRGGLVKYVELDEQLNPAGKGGERFVLIDPDPKSPVDNRYRGCEFYREGDTIYMYCGAANHPRVLAYTTAKVGDAKPENPRSAKPKEDSPTSEFNTPVRKEKKGKKKSKAQPRSKSSRGASTSETTITPIACCGTPASSPRALSRNGTSSITIRRA